MCLGLGCKSQFIAVDKAFSPGPCAQGLMANRAVRFHGRGCQTSHHQNAQELVRHSDLGVVHSPSLPPQRFWFMGLGWGPESAFLIKPWSGSGARLGFGQHCFISCFLFPNQPGGRLSPTVGLFLSHYWELSPALKLLFSEQPRDTRTNPLSSATCLDTMQTYGIFSL